MQANLLRIRFLLGLIVIIVILTAATSAFPIAAQSGGGYDLTWNVLAGGGATSLGGGAYTLSGTLGQPAAGTQSQAPYNLLGGFWIDFFGYRLYLPMIMR
jgi:hypothetical protein